MEQQTVDTQNNDVAVKEEEAVIKEEQEEKAALDAAFNDEPVVALDATQDGSTQEEDIQEEETPAEEPTPPQLFAGMTEEEIKQAVKNGQEIAEIKKELYRIHDKFYGRIGDFEQRIKDIPKPQVSGISPRAKERLSEEFPELAELLFGGVDEEPSAPSAPVAIPEPEPKVDVNQVVGDAMNRQSKSFEVRLLKRDHPDFESIKGSRDWTTWVNSRSSDEKQQIENSWDADYLSKKLTEFKDFLTGKKKNSEDKSEEKKKRLQAAITPRGDKSLGAIDPDDEEAAMMIAFNT